MISQTSTRWKYLGIGLLLGLLLGTGLGISLAKLFIKVSVALGWGFIVAALVVLLWLVWKIRSSHDD